MKKIIIYIDGSNFYFSIKNRFRCKVDIENFCEKLTNKKDIVKIKYYIAPVGESNPEMYAEQQRFFERLKKIENLEIIFGRLEKREKKNITNIS